MSSSRGVACLPESCPPCVSPYCLSDPSAVVPGKTRQPALRCSASAAVLAVARMNDPLVGFGSPAECNPMRSRRPLRIAAAFVRFFPLQRVRQHVSCPDVPGRTLRLQRSTPLTFYTLAAYATISRGIRSWGSPFGAFPSHFIPDPLSRSRREPRRVQALRPAVWPLPAYRLSRARPTNQFADRYPRPVSGLCSL